MFADWELIGVPHRVVIGERGLKEGKLEYQGRRDARQLWCLRQRCPTSFQARLAACILCFKVGSIYEVACYIAGVSIMIYPCFYVNY